jgi:hypothetical protein
MKYLKGKMWTTNDNQLDPSEINVSDVIRLTKENKINLDIRSKIFTNSFQIENYL